MVRVKEVLILEDTSFLDEKLSSGAFELSFRKMIYVLVGGLLSYKLIDSYKIPDILLGVVIIGIALALAFYPAKSIRLESVFIGAFSYLLGGFFTPDPDKVKEAEKKKQKKVKPKAKIETVKNTARITKIADKPTEKTVDNHVEKQNNVQAVMRADTVVNNPPVAKNTIIKHKNSLLLDYILTAVSGAFSLLLFRILIHTFASPSLITVIANILMFSVSAGVFIAELLYTIPRLLKHS
ncbi:hypothetical protein [Acidianus sp. HS-5]|uniref:hypothetical protein n=1 Tax=Acidianus sp. HS-5 TaxID=2886040 RepID=UPI001F444054|nr:hypothetical protein [Acidianus sp. HS-5]BDC18230.1 hypothetical protein HS5_11200 [Acidianus sp. HS-5]